MTPSGKVLDKLDVFQKNHEVSTLGEKGTVLAYWEKTKIAIYK